MATNIKSMVCETAENKMLILPDYTASHPDVLMYNVRSEVIVAWNFKTTVFWEVTPMKMEA